MPKALRVLPSLALAVLLTAAVTVLRTAPALATSNQETLFQDDGAMHADPQGTLQTIKGLGAERVRLFVYWASIAPNPGSRKKPAGFSPSDPGSYPAQNWTYYDTVVRDAKQMGIGVDFTVTGGGPLWATGANVPHGAKLPQIWRPSASEFGAFVTALAKRYSGSYQADGSALPRVDYWAIWNEPNYGQWLAPQAIPHHESVEQSPAIYRGLVNSAWNALHSNGHGHDTFLFGETAPRGLTSGDVPGNFGGMVPLRWLRALYCLDTSYHALRGSAASARGCPSTSSASRQFRASNPALFQSTGFAAHLYPQSQDPTKHTWPNRGADQYADLPNLPALLRLLDSANAAYGSHTHYKIYNTEYGYQTNPPLPGKVRQSTAAIWINWAEYLSWRNSRLVTFMQYGIADPPLNNFPSGLFDKHHRAKPSLDAFRLPLFLPHTSTRGGSTLEVWGAVRPAHNFPGTHQGLIQFQPGSHGAFTTLASVPIRNSRGYFDVRIKFPASGSVRLAWTDAGTPFFSRTQKISIH